MSTDLNLMLDELFGAGGTDASNSKKPTPATGGSQLPDGGAAEPTVEKENDDFWDDLLGDGPEEVVS